ncbi:5-hydroxytryptamine receptor 3C [Collichthys lucidus]|uniref:5-hydroxytryptamine receptor 3C n=1 Tax=Collichthys lucidus TaxID=240159 RepID=A0A4U5UK80_COLLU|nr:5-hydroxytryptamine receptor 3C [Collichthys lucidus]
MLSLVMFLILIPGLCSAIRVNCSEPTQPALLEALTPIFTMSAIRPVTNMTTRTNVSIFFTLYGILGVWWMNELVEWDPVQCGAEKISLPRKKFWVPDIVINELHFTFKMNSLQNVVLKCHDVMSIFATDMMHSPSNSVMLNCSRPDPPSLLEALGPVFNLSSIRPVMNMSTPTTVDIDFILFGILGVAALQLNQTLSVEEIFKNSKEVMTTMGEWELVGLKVKKYEPPAGDGEIYEEIRFFEGHSGPTYESMQAVFDLQAFRPAENLSNPTIANISFTLYAVLGVYWHHEFLVWEPEECDGVTKISLPVKQLWSPDIIVYEFVDDDVSQACPYVYVNHTGHIRWDRMLRLVSACNLEIFSFPFDVQNCTFTFGSYMHTIKDVRVSPALTFKEMSDNSKRYLEASGEWELVDILGETSILKFGIDEWDIITFWVTGTTEFTLPLHLQIKPLASDIN